jgi:hypothetical protein
MKLIKINPNKKENTKMKKTLTSLMVCLSLITLMGSAFAQSCTSNYKESANYWNMTTAQKNGDYSKFESTVMDLKRDSNRSNDAADEKNGDFYKVEATVINSKQDKNYSSETQAEKNGDFYKFEASSL